MRSAPRHERAGGAQILAAALSRDRTSDHAKYRPLGGVADFFVIAFLFDLVFAYKDNEHHLPYFSYCVFKSGHK